MNLKYLKFYYAVVYPPESLPIKAVRLDQAFINEKVPGVAAYPVTVDKKDREEVRSPDKTHWNGIKLRELRLATYPVINDQDWFTFTKNGEGKVKRVTLNQFLNQKGAKK